MHSKDFKNSKKEGFWRRGRDRTWMRFIWMKMELKDRGRLRQTCGKKGQHDWWWEEVDLGDSGIPA